MYLCLKATLALGLRLMVFYHKSPLPRFNYYINPQKNKQGLSVLPISTMEYVRHMYMIVEQIPAFREHKQQ